jgi:hypothetical protein
MSSASHDLARANWKRIGEIARRAGHDDPSESEDEGSMTPEQREQYKKKKREARIEREKIAKMMDLQYFLEMVDTKHRYGSNLRAYHEEWKKADTRENFFYWLDRGEGHNIELPTVSRQRLESEQVRYLSREERQKYLVTVDEDGRLCWAKNGERITTSTAYKDSINGIVPIDDPTPAWGSPDAANQALEQAQQAHTNTQQSNAPPESPGTRSSHTTSTIGSFPWSMDSDTEAEEAQHYMNHDLKKAKGLAKLKHISAAVVLNQLLQKSVKPNSWIFVADTSFRLYVGIKQSGVFQHSSFLNGGRIIAAGLIKIKDGQLRKLSPLSGHYRPPTRNFREFEKSLRDEGVDVSRTVRSRAYTVLLLLEAYVKTRKKIKRGWKKFIYGKDKLLHPEEVAKRKETEKDKSKSAQREREVLAEQANEEEMFKKRQSIGPKLAQKLHIVEDDDLIATSRNIKEKSIAGKNSASAKEVKCAVIEKNKTEEDKVAEAEAAGALSKPQQDPESAIPPEGKR